MGKEVVLNTWVIAKASSEETKKEIDEIKKSRELLRKIYNECHKVIFDRGEIFEEWKRYLYRSKDTTIWYAAMWASGKLEPKEGEEVELSNFPDPDDEKFVRVALVSGERAIITGDQEFLNWGRSQEARSLNVEVWSVEEALRRL